MALTRVYLDQWVWIRLSQAAHSRPDGKLYKEALEACREAASGGSVVFPLSGAHYVETQSERDGRPRRRLALLMVSLSRQNTIAPPEPILTMEIDCAVRDLFGLPVEPRRVEIFGVGFAHAFGRPSPFKVDESLPVALRDVILNACELAILEGQVTSLEPLWEHFRSISLAGARFAEDEAKISEKLAGANLHRGEELRKSMIVITLSEIIDAILESLLRGGAGEDEVGDLLQEGASRLFERIPSKHVVGRTPVDPSPES